MQSFEVALHGESSLYEPKCRFDLVYEPIALSLSSCLHPAQDELPTNSQTRDSSVNLVATDAGTLLSPSLNVDAAAPCNLYFTALAGPDGDEAVGFVRSLRKECLS
ncbi:hypothetical protein BDR05DRAFT_1002259 [Suillus weaverae]|nr:hypothetical protein BDR05DRAFT_1002259 [Suillus weaverae]